MSFQEIAGIADPSKQRAALDKFVAERFQGGMDAKKRELSDALKRYTLHSMQKYRTRYLLAKLTQYVDGAYKGLAVPGSLNEYQGAEIEHILPDVPKADLRSAFAVANPDANYEEYKVKLGNLTLLEKPINIVASNGFFEAKKEGIPKVQILSEQQYRRDHVSWEKQFDHANQ